MTLGLAREAVQVVPYHPEWVQFFQEEAAVLRAVLKEHALQVEHIGSTAIVGMDAKPIIDLLVAVPHLEQAKTFMSALEALGYEYLPDEPPPDRLFFAKGPRSKRTHHLSLTEPTATFYQRMVVFRDYLRTHASVAEEYRRLKRESAQKYPEQRALYTAGKGPFVERVLELVRTTT